MQGRKGARDREGFKSKSAVCVEIVWGWLLWVWEGCVLRVCKVELPSFV